MADSGVNRIVIVGLLLAMYMHALNADELDDVLQQWAATRNHVRQVTAVVEGERMYAKGSITDSLDPGDTRTIPATDLVFAESYTIMLDFEHSWARIDEVRPTYYLSDDNFAQCTQSRSYDGMHIYNFTPRADNPQLRKTALPEYTPDLQIMPDTFADLFFEPTHYPVLFLTGNIINSTTGMSPLNLHLTNSKSDYKLKGRGSIEGREHLIVVAPREVGQRPAYYEYWVDPLRHGAISKWLMMSNEKPRLQLSVAAWRQQDDLWIPQLWRFDAFESNGAVGSSVQGELKSVRVNQPREQAAYQINEIPGMYVINRVTKERYEVQRNGGKIPMKQVIDAYHARSNNAVTYAYFVSAAFIVVVTGLGFRWLLRKR